jgi:hypothetical protein
MFRQILHLPYPRSGSWGSGGFGRPYIKASQKSLCTYTTNDKTASQLWHVDALPSNSCVNRRQYNSRFWGHAVSPATREHTIMVFSVLSMPRLYKEGTLPLRESPETAIRTRRKLVWDGRQPARTWVRKQRNIHCWKTLPSSAVKTVTENTSLCVIVICQV